MLDPSLLAQLQAHAEKIVEPVVLAATLDDSKRSADMAELLDELASVSDLVTVEHRNDADRAPSFVIERTGTDVRVGFAGLPLGHEFTSLVLALLQVGGHPPRLEDDIAEQVRALDVDAEFETFFSLSCQNCPDVVQALNAMSVLNPRIRHTAIDGAAFQDEASEREVMAVPAVFKDGEIFEQGRVGVEQLLAKLDASSTDQAAEKINAKDPFDVLIVGGGPAGSAAAVYAARKGLRTGVVADRFGGQLLDTMGIENFISVPYTEGPKLSAALEQHVREYEVDVMVPQRAQRVIPAEVEGGSHTVGLESGASVQARVVVASTGARWRHLDVEGEADHLNKGVAFCPHCDGPMFKGKKVAVVGGGNSGVEAAIDLAGIVEHVTLLEFQEELIADGVLQSAVRDLPNVDVITRAATNKIIGDGSKVSGLQYLDLGTDADKTVDVAGIFVQIGLLPNTEWLEGVVELTDRGEIVVDDHGRTNVPGIVAAGDCTTEPYKQIVIALGAGATAGLAAFDHLIRTKAPATSAS